MLAADHNCQILSYVFIVSIFVCELFSDGQRRDSTHTNPNRPCVEGSISIQTDTKRVLSMALIPAWRGERGQMIFGAKRVNAGEAATVHEMIHVYEIGRASCRERG